MKCQKSKAQLKLFQICLKISAANPFLKQFNMKYLTKNSIKFKQEITVHYSLWSLSLCSVQCYLWSLSLCSVQCYLWSLSLCSVQCYLWSLSLCSIQCSLCSLSLCRVQCTLRSLSLCSLPPLCSGNARPRSPYSLTSKRCSSQSLLPFRHSAVPKILQSMLTAIKLQPSWHPRCCFLSPKLSQKFRSHSIIFTGTSAELSTYIYIYKMLYNVPI
jgi:hypothetical protein